MIGTRTTVILIGAVFAGPAIAAEADKPELAKWTPIIEAAGIKAD
jgi:hypothetical protein